VVMEAWPRGSLDQVNGRERGLVVAGITRSTCSRFFQDEAGDVIPTAASASVGGGITAHLRIPIRPRTAINDPLSNCVVDVVPDEPSCLHAWRSPSRRLMKRTGSAKASSGDSNQTTRANDRLYSALSGIGFIGSAPVQIVSTRCKSNVRQSVEVYFTSRAGQAILYGIR
jgi:hypothetical protein